MELNPARNRANEARRVVRALGLLFRASALLVVLPSASCRPPAAIRSFTIQPWTLHGQPGQHIRTQHFDVYCTVPNQAFVEAIPGLLETAYDEYVRALPSVRTDSRRLTTYLFATRAEWERFTSSRYPRSYPVYQFIRSGGFSEKETAVLFYCTPALTFATLAHEGWHQYAACAARDPLPGWLNEGLACTFESFDFTHSPPKPAPLLNTFRLDDLRQALLESRSFTIREILETHTGEVLSRDHSPTTQAYYAGLWGLVTFLQHGEDHKYAPAFERLLADVADGSFEIRVRAALITQATSRGAGHDRAVFEVYFGGVDDALERAYQSYLRELAGF